MPACIIPISHPSTCSFSHPHTYIINTWQPCWRGSMAARKGAFSREPKSEAAMRRHKRREATLTLKSIGICTGARRRWRCLGPDNGGKGALLFHCRDDIGRWEWENAVCTATVWREADRRGCHGRARWNYCNRANIVTTQREFHFLFFFLFSFLIDESQGEPGLASFSKNNHGMKTNQGRMDMREWSLFSGGRGREELCVIVSCLQTNECK